MVIKSESFANLLVKWYPAIERRLSGSGLWRIGKRLIGLYKDKDYTGAIESIEAAYKRAQLRKELVIPEGGPAMSLPKLSDVWPRIKAEVEKLKPENQEDIGTCAIWTVQNILNQIIWERGLEEYVELDISLMYKDYGFISKKDPGADLGTVVEDLWKILEKEGAPLRTLKPIKSARLLKALRLNSSVAVGHQFRIRFVKKMVHYGTTFGELVTAMQTYDPVRHKIQGSLDIYRHKDSKKSFWNNWIIKWFSGMYKTGRHSVAILFGITPKTKTCISPMESTDGRGVVVIDSGDGQIKFVTESYLEKADFSFRVFEIALGTFIPNQVVVPEPVPQPIPEPEVPKPVRPLDDLATTEFKFGYSGPIVMKMQQYLVSRGHLDKSKVNGKFQNSTKLAIGRWLKAGGKAYSSIEMWGPICQALYKEENKMV